MANTENIEAKLCAYVDGELDPAGRAEIEAHLAAHPQHQQLMAELMQQRELLAALPRDRAPEDLFEAMTNQLERSVLLDGDAAGAATGGGGGAGGGHVAGRINPWPQVFAAAAVLGLAIGLAAVIYFVLPKPNEQPSYVYSSGTAAPTAAPTTAAPPAAMAGPSRVLTETADTQPVVTARRDADRIEAKTGTSMDTGAGVAGIAPGETNGSAAAAAPSAVAAVPAPPAPAAVPATPASPAPAPSDDIFSPSGGHAQAKVPNDVPALTNAFADSLLNEKLKAAADVPDNSMLVVVNSGDPSATNQQIQEYFANNNIRWQSVTEPIPNLDLHERQTMVRSRLNNTQMSLKGGGEPAAEAPPVPPAPDDKAEARREITGANPDAAQVLGDANKDNSLSGAGQPAAPAPADAAGNAKADARVSRKGAGDRFGGAGGVGGVGAATEPPGKAGASVEDVEHDRATNELAAQSPAQPRQTPGTAEEIAENSSAPRAAEQQQQQQSPARQQAEVPLAQQQQQQPGGLQTPDDAMRQQQLGSVAQASPQSQSQLFIARGLTKQQVFALNTAFGANSRVNNYNRSGNTITPTTLPSAADLAQNLATASQPAAQDPLARMKKGWDGAPDEARERDLATAPPPTVNQPPTVPPSTVPANDEPAYANRGVSATDTAASTGGAPDAGTGSGGANSPSGVVTGSVSGSRSGAGVGGSSSSSPDAGDRVATTGPATTQAAQSLADADADERVDVVILIQSDTGGDAQVRELLPGGAPTAPSTAPAATAPVPTSGPAPSPTSAEPF